jgi:hypothetical protein
MGIREWKKPLEECRRHVDWAVVYEYSVHCYNTDSSEPCNETFDSLQSGTVLRQLNAYQLLKKESAPRTSQTAVPLPK